MAEQEVNYASVVFKADQPSPSEAKNEETLYDEVKNQQNQTLEPAGDTNDQKANSRHRWLLVCCSILCITVLAGVIAVSLCITKLSQQLRENQSTLQAVDRNLTDLKHDLNSDSEDMKREHDNLTGQLDNLTQSYTAVKSEIAILTAESQELNTTINKLTEKIENMEKERKHNIGQAQWSNGTFCHKRAETKVRRCQACQDGWTSFQSSCYAINDAERMTWDEAQTNCRGKISDLVVIADEDEKSFISGKGRDNGGLHGYWIGLKVKQGKWKWVDGSDLTEGSWIKHPAADGHCAVSAESEGFRSVNCTTRNRWICKKKTLSV